MTPLPERLLDGEGMGADRIQARKAKLAANDNLTKLAYSVEEAGPALGVGRSTIFELLKEGRLKRVKIGSKTVIPRSSLLALLGDTDAAA